MEYAAATSDYSFPAPLPVRQCGDSTFLPMPRCAADFAASPGVPIQALQRVPLAGNIVLVAPLSPYTRRVSSRSMTDRSRTNERVTG
ncbi:hypothetical protein D3C85_1821660 [compost metagenome]